MSGEIPMTVVGNLTADPELKVTQGGHSVANFTVACTPRIFDKATSQWHDGDTVFLRVSAWRDLGENVAASLSKGMRVMVTGTLRIRQFVRDDQSKGTSVEVMADEVAASLRYATAVPVRATRSAGAHLDAA